MTMLEAANHVCSWLKTQQCYFTPMQVQETEPKRFRVMVHQALPENKQRVFDVAPTEVADCWNVTEVAA
jgi:hypothetical protein